MPRRRWIESVPKIGKSTASSNLRLRTSDNQIRRLKNTSCPCCAATCFSPPFDSINTTVQLPLTERLARNLFRSLPFRVEPLNSLMAMRRGLWKQELGLGTAIANQYCVVQGQRWEWGLSALASSSDIPAARRAILFRVHLRLNNHRQLSSLCCLVSVLRSDDPQTMAGESLRSAVGRLVQHTKHSIISIARGIGSTICSLESWRLPRLRTGCQPWRRPHVCRPFWLHGRVETTRAW